MRMRRDIGYNHITKLRPGDFANLTALRFLGLETNELRGIPPGVFRGLRGLATLLVYNNYISTWQRAAESNPSVGSFLDSVSVSSRNSTTLGVHRTCPHASEIEFGSDRRS